MTSLFIQFHFCPSASSSSSFLCSICPCHHFGVLPILFLHQFLLVSNFSHVFPICFPHSLPCFPHAFSFGICSGLHFSPCSHFINIYSFPLLLFLTLALTLPCLFMLFLLLSAPYSLFLHSSSGAYCWWLPHSTPSFPWFAFLLPFFLHYFSLFTLSLLLLHFLLMLLPHPFPPDLPQPLPSFFSVPFVSGVLAPPPQERCPRKRGSSPGWVAWASPWWP